MKYAVIKTGGKQYLVSEKEEIIVDRLKGEKNSEVSFETLAVWDGEKEDLKLGKPTLNSQVKGKIVDHFKGEKIRISKFKAKVRYRRTTGFRPYLTKVQIVKI